MKKAKLSPDQCVQHLSRAETFETINRAVFHDLALKLEPISLNEGETLFSFGDNADSMYIVVEGSLQAVIDSREGKLIVLRDMGTGVPVGEIALLLGGKRTATVLAAAETTLARLPKNDFEKILDKYPQIRLRLLDAVRYRLRRTQLAKILPQYFGEMDASIFDYIETQFEWINLAQGEILFKKGDVGDSLFILINGLLHVVDNDRKADDRLISVVHSGEIVGEMAVLTGEKRTACIIAARDSYLVKLTKKAFNSICEKFPRILMAITRILVKRLSNITEKKIQRNTAVNIVVMPITPGVRINNFAEHLIRVIKENSSAVLITSGEADRFFNRKGISQIPKNDPLSQSIYTWLEDIESSYDFVVYMTDHDTSNWTKRCISRADQVLLLADADAPPLSAAIEKQLFNNQSKCFASGKLLVLIQPRDVCYPTGTIHWLKERHIENHFHLRWDVMDDFRRLARILGKRAVGIALGGGAAKGLAHIGVLKALDEAGIPVDMVGGSSIGAIVGALYSMGRDFDEMIHVCKKLFIDINPFNDYTLPVVSLMGEKKLERMGKLAYGNSDIEDLWKNFFCVSSNLTTSELKIYRRGSLWRAVRASSSIPGVIVPVVEEGNIVVDGGLINNLPGDILRRFCGSVIAVEVNANIDLTVPETVMPSPWKIIWNKLHPGRKTLKVPNILEIMLSTLLTGSFMAANSVKQDADLTITPPLQNVGLLDFKNIEKTVEIGYSYTLELLEKTNDCRINTIKGIRVPGQNRKT